MNNLRGYTKLTFSGNDYHVLLNMNAFRMYCEAEKIKLGELQQNIQDNALDFYPKIVLHGINNYADFHSKDRPEIKSNFLAAQVNAMEPEQMEQLNAAIGSAMGGGEKNA